MNNFGKLVFSIILVFSMFSFGQKVIDSHSNAWLIYTGNHPIYKNWSLHTEYQFRRSDFLKDWQQSLTRIGIDYNTKDGSIFSLGYGFIRSFPYGKQPIPSAFNEHRVWQTITFKNQYERVEIQHRYRFEQRFLENLIQDKSSKFYQNGFNFKHRFRYRFLINIPLNNRILKDKTWFLSFYDEIFLGFGSGIGKNVLEQNRASGLLAYRFSKKCTLQVGYLNQYIVKSDGIHSERNHTAQMMLVYNVDFKKVE